MDKWPIVFVSAAMVVAAVIDGWKLKVPNWLTFPLILGGWVLGAVYWLTQTIPPLTTPEGNRLAASLVCTLLGFLLLLPIYSIGGMGAGDVKMQMGFGAWVGAYYGLYEGAEGGQSGVQIMLYGFCAGVIVGGILAAGMILIRRQYQRNFQNAREILTDLATSGSIGKVAEKAAERKSRLQLLPYGIPLCIGFVGYLVYLHI